ncbi:cell death specification protein 2 [Cephus cinctus]|uniref:Cell death specification protein 2 n=1 Tax=Cephus cinctus TaxID=211228 RepID=A0AAJ7BJZ9_CEPCN|nr:cell death specification protein 2 [Cephus cinctus]XP_015587982.1 cell death specification protein 2 [Cephus cinctus]XP_015587983.1 cell death specification protein 2 [Cephus cinctus]
MEDYQTAMDNLEALDFTKNLNQKVNECSLEPPVLDLSCKKQTRIMNDCLSMGYEESMECISNSRQQSGLHCSELERKSPFEGRTFMVTPPSETDSPKKTKYEAIYNEKGISTSSETMGHQTYPIMPMVSIPASNVLSGLLPNGQSIVPSLKNTQLPVSTVNLDASSPLHSPEMTKKAPRPFKAYPKDPLSLSMGTAELVYDQNSTEAYSEFRKRMLESVRRTNEGTNIKMRRVTKSPGLPTSTVDEKDAAYWERRRKNNEAAKRSRDARRAKEDEIAIRAAFLEQENMKLKYELVALRNETAKLRCMVYSN